MTKNKGVARGGPWSPGPPIECCLALLRNNNEQVSDFRLNFSWVMFKMCYFSNKFSTIAKRWGFSTQTTLNFRFWWPEVAWVC